jgi:hypothetical protein
MTPERDKPEDVPKPFDYLAFIEEKLSMLPPGEAERLEAENAANERRERLKASGIEGAISPDDVERIVRDELIDTKALRAVKRWAHVRSSGTSSFAMLVIDGDMGIGKTVAGGWILARKGGFFATLEALRTSRCSRDRKDFERACRTACLVVDELGIEDDDEDSGQRALYELVNRRGGLAGAWTLFTTNLQRPELLERYDLRTIQRIEHRGIIFHVDGPNLRMRLEDILEGKRKP